MKTVGVEFQVKATDKLRFVDKGKCVSCVVETAHCRYWYWEVAHPFILVLYDAQKHRAFWIDVQRYVDEHVIEDKETVAIWIPTKNRLSLFAIDRFRKMSLARNISGRAPRKDSD